MIGDDAATRIPAQGVPRLRYPFPLEVFYRDYYIPRRPLIITTDSFSQLGWHTSRWDNDYLLYKAGAQEVMVLQRNGAGNFAPEQARYRPMRFHEFMSRVMASSAGDQDLYLNLQNDQVMEPPLLQLIGDFNVPVYFKDLTLRCINLWMGNSPASITTPLHHDFNDNLYAVVEGRKHFTLFPPEQAPNLYPQGQLKSVDANGYIHYEDLDHKPHMCQVDPTAVDLQRFPLYGNAAAARFECHVEKHEMLFLPTGWFHQVTSWGRHVAVSFFSMPPSLSQLDYLKGALAERTARRRQ